MAAIVKALLLPQIHDLSQTFAELSKEDRKLLAEVIQLVKSEREYRNRLNVSQEPCVPRLGTE